VAVVSRYYGSAFGKHLVAPIIELVSTPDRKGYWLIGADGSVYRSGCGVRGRCRRQAAAGPGRGRRDDSGRRGYWLVTVTGGVMAFGDARNYGSIRSPITGHVVAIVATTTARIWIACSTRGVFNFGDARFYGSRGRATSDS